MTGVLQLTCQRCNAPFDFSIDRKIRFRFVATEEDLNLLPIDDDESDAMVGSSAMNVASWIEDEVMLSLPLVPRHDECSTPRSSPHDIDPAVTPNAFAVLASVRSKVNEDEGPA
ncbi:MAG: DUF177 domain-containing protein [Burkholderiaceae bacterium]